MKQTLTLIAFTLSIFGVFAQTSSYPFTNGSLSGLTHLGTGLTIVPDRINVATDAIDINNDYLRTATFATTNLTMSFWVRTSTVDGNKRIIIEQSARNSSADNSNQAGWYTYLKNGKAGFAANYWHTHDVNSVPVVSYTGYTYMESTTNIADGYWHNVIMTAQKAVIYQNGWLKRYTYNLYVDGVLENTQVIDRGSGSSSSNINASLVPNALAMTIANNNSSNLAATSRYQDEIDDIKYYNSVVSSTVINTLANEKRCSTPENIVVSSIGATSATVTWGLNTDALTWDLIYVASGQPMNSGTLVSAIATNSYSLSGLTSSTAYDIYIKSNCNGFSGWWSVPNAFTTICPSTFANAIAQNITVQLNNLGQASITPASINNGSTVECGVLNLSINQTDFDCSDVGVNVVTLTAIDNQGHTSTATSNVTVIGLINDENLTAAQTNLCPGSSTTISTASSSTGVTYTLKNTATNAVVGTPLSGNGSALTFNTGILNSTQTFKVVGEKNPNMKYALDFDGSNDIVTTPITTTATSTLSLEAWIYPRSTNYDRIISSYNNSSATSGEVILDTYNATNNGRALRLVVEGSGNVLAQISTANVLTLNAWNHVAGTFDNGTLKIYVNGVVVGTTTATFTSIPACTNVICIGEDPTILTAEYFNGKMDEVRIWNTARTASEISSNMNNCLTGTETGLKSYFKVSEGTGTTLTDLVAGSIGTMSGMDAATDWVTGYVDCGSSVCTFEMSDLITVTVNDNVAPVPALSSLSTITTQCSVTSLTAPTALDNCAGTITGIHNTTLPITTNTTITWTYNDGNGNITTQTQSVVVNDNVAPVPVVSVLLPITSQCDISTLTAPTALDNCVGTITGTHATVLPITSNTTITWTYNDGHGNITTQTQNVIIDDITAPVPTLSALPDLTAECSISTLVAPTAMDNCVGIINGDNNVTLPITSSTVITWTYDDGQGNTATQTQNVIIDDVTAPVPTLSTLPDLTAQCSISTLIAPTAIDNCVGIINGDNNVTLPITSSTVITWTYDDGQGNTATQTQNVIIDDVTAPVPTLSTLPDLTAECSISTLVAPTAMDNCVGIINGDNNVTLPITSSTVITWTYVDGQGNTTTQIQNVIIDDVTAPVPDFILLGDITATCEVTTLTAPTAMDNCAGSITATHNALLPITANSTITWTFDDGNGNVITEMQEVIITGFDVSISQSNNTISANNTTADTYQWVDCDNSNAPIAGETSAIFTPTVNGNYAVEITVGNCIETSSCTAIETIGLDEVSNADFVIYPNPAVSEIKIDSDFPFEKVEIYTIQGEFILSTQENSIAISHLVTGVYLLKFISDSEVVQRTFIKQ